MNTPDRPTKPRNPNAPLKPSAHGLYLADIAGKQLMSWYAQGEPEEPAAKESAAKEPAAKESAAKEHAEANPDHPYFQWVTETHDEMTTRSCSTDDYILSRINPHVCDARYCPSISEDEFQKQCAQGCIVAKVCAAELADWQQEVSAQMYPWAASK